MAQKDTNVEMVVDNIPKTGKDRQKHMLSKHKPLRTTVIGRTLDKRRCFGLLRTLWFYMELLILLYIRKVQFVCNYWNLSMCKAKRVYTVREISFYHDAESSL